MVIWAGDDYESGSVPDSLETYDAVHYDCVIVAGANGTEKLSGAAAYCYTGFQSWRYTGSTNKDGANFNYVRVFPNGTQNNAKIVFYLKTPAADAFDSGVPWLNVYNSALNPLLQIYSIIGLDKTWALRGSVDVDTLKEFRPLSWYRFTINLSQWTFNVTIDKLDNVGGIAAYSYTSPDIIYIVGFEFDKLTEFWFTGNSSTGVAYHAYYIDDLSISETVPASGSPQGSGGGWPFINPIHKKNPLFFIDERGTPTIDFRTGEKVHPDQQRLLQVQRERPNIVIVPESQLGPELDDTRRKLSILSEQLLWSQATDQEGKARLRTETDALRARVRDIEKQMTTLQTPSQLQQQFIVIMVGIILALLIAEYADDYL